MYFAVMVAGILMPVVFLLLSAVSGVAAGDFLTADWYVQLVSSGVMLLLNWVKFFKTPAVFRAVKKALFLVRFRANVAFFTKYGTD